MEEIDVPPAQGYLIITRNEEGLEFVRSFLHQKDAEAYFENMIENKEPLGETGLEIVILDSIADYHFKSLRMARRVPSRWEEIR
jgi:hypothetical protein